MLRQSSSKNRRIDGARVSTDDPRRRIELAAIHVAKKQLRLDDDLYRRVIERVSAKFRATPVTSSALLTPRERAALIEEMRRLGFRKIEGAPKQPASGQVQKIVALWHALRDTGALHDSSDKALRAFVKRQTRMEAARWLTPTQANKVIEALKGWLGRVEAKSASDANPRSE